MPPFALGQAEVTRRIELALGPRSPQILRLLPMFANTGIERRYSSVPIEWYERLHDWRDRNSVYLRSAADLLETAARDALQRAGCGPRDISGVVTVSTSGIATPSLDAVIAERMGLRADITRLPIFGMGCAGGVTGVARAAGLARERPDGAVLLLVVELCALSFRRDDFSKSNIVATALFGDGAAAAVLSCSGAGPRVVGSGEHRWPSSLDVMGWDVCNDGLKAIFSRDIPHLVTGDLHAVAADFLAKYGLQLHDVDRFICHPGGAKVLDALEFAYEVPAGTLRDARGVLREYGNMSAATVLFVLQRALECREWRLAMLSSLGPGFTAAFTLLERSS